MPMMKVYVREVVNYIHEFEVPEGATEAEIKAAAAKSWIEKGDCHHDFYSCDERDYEIEGADFESYNQDEVDFLFDDDYPPVNEKEARDRLDAME